MTQMLKKCSIFVLKAVGGTAVALPMEAHHWHCHSSTDLCVHSSLSYHHNGKKLRQTTTQSCFSITGAYKVFLGLICVEKQQKFLAERHAVSKLTSSPSKAVLLLRKRMQDLVNQFMENVYCLRKNNSSFLLWNFKHEELSLALKTVLRE